MAHGSTDAAGARPDRLRTHAIELYCRELCGSDNASPGATDVLEALSPADAAGGDDQLLRVTRTAAARHVPRKAAPAGWRGMLTAEHECDCDLTPALLAQSANGELPPARQTKLDNHLSRCLFCRAAQVREQRSSRAFAAVLATGLAGQRRARSSPAEPSLFEQSAALVSSPPATAALAAEPLPDAPPSQDRRSRRGFAVYPANRPPATTARRQVRLSRPTLGIAAVAGYAPFLVTLALGVVLIIGVSVLLGGGSSGQAAAAQLPPPSASSTPPAAVGIAVTRAAPKPPPAPKLAQTTPTRTTPTATTTSTIPKPVAAAPAATPAPSAPPPAAPKPTPPPSPSHSSGSTGGSSNSQPAVATQQGNPLPAQPAPTQGIGGGTSTGP